MKSIQISFPGLTKQKLTENSRNSIFKAESTQKVYNSWEKKIVWRKKCLLTLGISQSEEFLDTKLLFSPPCLIIQDVQTQVVLLLFSASFKASLYLIYSVAKSILVSQFALNFASQSKVILIAKKTWILTLIDSYFSIR